jgi:hypothetical protein
MVESGMDDIAHLLQDPETTVAVVGATDHRHKYGSIIYRDLKAKGFTVFAVNQYRQTVDADRTYATLDDLPEAPTIVNIVVPPADTLSVLEDARRLGYTNVWIQPGAENDAVYEYLAANEFNALVGACIMVRSRVLIRS